MNRFKKVKSGIKDKKTKLIWAYMSHKKMGYNEAITYCKELNHNGKSDWRLPSVSELQSILDYTQSEPAIPNKLKVFNEVVSYYYWSSTTYVNTTNNAWFVYLNNGYVYHDSKGNNYYVWPVRDGK